MSRNIGCDNQFHGAFKEVSKQGRGRLVPVKRRATNSTRGRGRPRPILEPTREEFHMRLLISDGGVFDDATVKKIHDAIGVPGKSRIVCDHADGGAFLVQMGQQVHHRLAVF